MTESVQEKDKKTSEWKNRKKLYLTRWQTSRLSKGRKAHVMLDSQYYELIPNSKTLVVIDGKKYKVANGALKKVKALLGAK